jgi:hypothetical protein
VYVIADLIIELDLDEVDVDLFLGQLAPAMRRRRNGKSSQEARRATGTSEIAINAAMILKMRFVINAVFRCRKNTGDSGNKMHPTVMHKQVCSTQIQNAFETMLDFIIVSLRSSVGGRCEYACR